MKSRTELKEALENKELALRSINFGLVYIDKDFQVQWETTTKIQQLVTNHRYVPGYACFQTTGFEFEACTDCPFKAAVQLGEMAKRMMHVDGLYYEVAATPVYNDSGELVGGLLRIEDVTEKIQMENSLREAKDKAEEANRLKTAFLSNISHEIRTPLNAILGFSDLLCRADDEGSKQEFYKIIQNNSNLLLHLVDNVLDLSKIEAGMMEIVYASTNVNDLMLGLIVQLQKKHSNASVEIKVVEKPEVCIIQTDRVKLAQVITNLMGNAIKFTSIGSVSLGYRFEKEDNSELYVYVKDTGVGIPADKQTVIFDRFVKIDPFVQGTGLGLSICQHILSRMKGSMGVESEVGKGSCFWFRVPVKPT